MELKVRTSNMESESDLFTPHYAQHIPTELVNLQDYWCSNHQEGGTNTSIFCIFFKIIVRMSKGR